MIVLRQREGNCPDGEHQGIIKIDPRVEDVQLLGALPTPHCSKLSIKLPFILVLNLIWHARKDCIILKCTVFLLTLNTRVEEPEPGPVGTVFSWDSGTGTVFGIRLQFRVQGNEANNSPKKKLT
jgi:hypothetical protein